MTEEEKKVEETYLDFKKNFITSPDWGHEFNTTEFKEWLSTHLQPTEAVLRDFKEWFYNEDGVVQEPVNGAENPFIHMSVFEFEEKIKTYLAERGKK